MNTNQLLCFVMTVKLGSYAAAAKSVYLSSPGVSRAVGELEKELGIKLVERAGKVVKPTVNGCELYKKAIGILEEVDDLKSTAKLMVEDRGRCGSFKMAVSVSPYRGALVDQCILDSLEGAFQEQYVSILKGSSSSCLAALEEGIVQAAIILGRAEKSGFASCRLYSIKPRIMMSKRHPLASQPLLTALDILNYPIARPSDLRYCYSAITDALGKTGRSPMYQEVYPSAQDHIDFLQKDYGVIFVSPDPSLESLYPGAILSALEHFGVSIPVCFTYRKEAESGSIAVARTCLVAATRVLSKYGDSHSGF